MTRKTAIVICPGRGTYNAAELGYLKTHHAGKDIVEAVDSVRRDAGQSAISTLDTMDRFSPSTHGRGDNASALIYACAVGDYLSINNDIYDIVGVTGNSMGWYLSLAVGGALSLKNGAFLVNTMGGIMTEHGQGGQIVYPVVDENWRPDPARQTAIETLIEKAARSKDMTLSLSISLGGMAVLAGNEAGLNEAMQVLPKQEHFPFRLRGHAAFHSALLDHTIPLAHKAISPDIFNAPTIPLIDGLGHIWSPGATDIQALYDYTLGRQINETYNFSKAVEVAAKEFAPDVFIVLGPGTTMGGAVAQSLIAHDWDGVSDKAAFKARQKSDPIILSMGMSEQRTMVI